MAYKSGEITAARLREQRTRLLLETQAAFAMYEEADRKRQAAEAEVAREAEARARGSYSVGERILGTGMDVTGQVVGGALGGVEGLMDAAVGVVSMPTLTLMDTLMGTELSKKVRAFMEKDHVELTREQMVAALTDFAGFDPQAASYQQGKVGSFLQNVEQGVGNMLPAVAVSVLTAGAGAPATVAQGASLATTGASAAGQGMQEAYRDGAGNMAGLGYGVASGAVEAGTEKLFGGVTKFTHGKGWFDDIVPSVARKGAARVVREFAEEGAEEAISEMVNPALQGIYKGKDALGAYTDPEHYKGVVESFLVGGATALAYLNTVGRVMAKSGRGHVGKEADAEALTEDIAGLARQARNARKHYKLTPELVGRIDEQVRRRYADLEEVLGKIKPERRATLIEELSLGEAFDAEGKMDADFRRRLGSGGEGSGLAVHPEFYKGDPDRVRRALEVTGAEAVSDMESLSAVERDNYREFLRVAERLDDVSGGAFDFVLVEPGESRTGAYVVRDDVILVSRETLQSPERTAEVLRNGWFGVTVEESLHKSNAKGGEVYEAFMQLMLKDKDTVKATTRELVKLGYFGANMTEAYAKVNRLMQMKAKNMTEQDRADVETLYDELVAHLGRNALSTRHFYRRLVEEDKTAAERFLDALRRLKERKGKKSGQKVGKVAEAEVDKWAEVQEEAFLVAVAEAGYMVNEAGKIVGVDDEEEKKSEYVTEHGIRYSIIRQIYSSERITRNMHDLADMKSVYDVDVSKLEKTGKRPSEIYTEYFSDWGENIYTEEFGDVALRASSVKSEIRHGNMAEKIATIEAIPFVLREGKVIFTGIKQGDVERVVVAAPIQIGEDSYYMGVMLQRDGQNQRLYLHNVVAEKETATSSVWSLTNRTDDSGSDSLFITSILQKALDVKRNLKKSAGVRYSNKAPSENEGDRKATRVLEALIGDKPFNAKDRAWLDDFETQLEKTRAGRALVAELEQKVQSYREEIADIRAEIDRLSRTRENEELRAELVQERKRGGLMLEQYKADLKTARWRLNADEQKLRDMETSDMGEKLRRVKQVVDTASDKTRALKVELSSTKAELREERRERITAEGQLMREREHAAEQDAKVLRTASTWQAYHDAKMAKATKSYNDMMRYHLDRHRNTVAKNREKYQKMLQTNSEQLKKVREESRKREAERREKETVTHWLNKAAFKAQKIKEWKSEEFRAASQIGNQDTLGAIGMLSKTLVQGNISITDTRKAARSILEWYRLEDTKRMLGGTKDTVSDKITGGLFSVEIEGMLEGLAGADDGTTVPFTSEEARDLCHVLDYFKHVVEHTHKVLVGGKWIDAKETAKDYRAKADGRAYNLRHFRGMRSHVEEYGINFNDPASIMRYFDGYVEGGFLSDMFEAFRRANTDTDYIKHSMVEKVRKFEQEHKGYFNEVDKKVVKVKGQENVPLMVALYIYEALGRDQAVPHLMANGYKYFGADGKQMAAPGFMPEYGKDTTKADMQPIIDQVRGEIMSQLGATDKAFLQVAEEIFNEDCKTYKRETDMKLYGYSNVIEGLYVPIRIAEKAVHVDSADYRSEMDRATNASFNKKVTKGAKNSIMADSLIDVLMRHVDGISRYAGMSEAIIAYEMLLSVDVGDNPGNPQTVKTAYDKIWGKFRDKDGHEHMGHIEYVKDMVNDMQGIPVGKATTPMERVLDWMRGKHAVAVLGANPKVWVTQFSSLIASTSILDPKYVLKGTLHRTGKEGVALMDQYCHLAMLRNADNTAVRAQTVSDQISKVGEHMTGLIGKTDRLVVARLWNACVLQTAAEHHLAVDSEETYIKAGELLARVIYETQQNAQATEKSVAMRGNAYNKLVTMFRADFMKVVGRVFDGAGEFRATRKNKEFPHLYDDARHQAAKKKLVKAATAMGMQALYMAIVSMLARKLIARDDEDTFKAWSTDDLLTGVGDMFSSLIGGLPMIGDVFEFFMSGFDIEDMGVGAVNDLLRAVQNFWNTFSGIVSGDVTGEDAATAVRLIFYEVGKTLGIPLQNIYKYMRGSIYHVGDGGEQLVYRLDSVFKTPSYSADIGRAIEAEDEERVAFLTGLALDERVSLAQNSVVREELVRLTNAGEDILPRSVGTSIGYDGEEYAMTLNQQKRFRTVYEGANEAVLRLVQSSYYKGASDSVKAKAVARVYKLYYNLAIEEILGVEMEQKAQLFAKVIPPEKLAIIIAEARELRADVDDDGRVINGSKRRKVAAYVDKLRLTAAQKYLVFAYLGYKTVNGRDEVEAYVKSLDLSRAGKEEILRVCGYEV